MIEEINSFNFNTTPRIIYGPNVAKDADPFSKLIDGVISIPSSFPEIIVKFVELPKVTEPI